MTQTPSTAQPTQTTSATTRRRAVGTSTTCPRAKCQTTTATTSLASLARAARLASVALTSASVAVETASLAKPLLAKVPASHAARTRRTSLSPTCTFRLITTKMSSSTMACLTARPASRPRLASRAATLSRTTSAVVQLPSPSSFLTLLPSLALSQCTPSALTAALLQLLSHQRRLLRLTQSHRPHQ